MIAVALGSYGDQRAGLNGMRLIATVVTPRIRARRKIAAPCAN